VDTVSRRARPHAALAPALARAGLVGWLLVAAPAASAHAFPDHSDPRVGHSLDRSPPAVRIWSDPAIEPVFSQVRVEDGDGRRVDNGDARVDAADSTLLQVSLPALSPGRYQVIWNVVARDGHRTEGRFTFRVR